MKIAFVTNFCPHYRVRTFELLAAKYDIDFYFFSAGKEWYWQQRHGTQSGNFNYHYLPGFTLNKTRVTPTLPSRLIKENYDVYVKCINGRFALPVSYAVARLKRKPFILWTGIWMRINTPAHRLFFPLTRYIYRHSNAVAVYGKHVRNYLLTEGVDKDRIFVAPHAVDNDFYRLQVRETEKNNLRGKLKISKKDTVILFMGRLELSKGLPYLIEAVAGLLGSGCVLVIAGNGSQRESIESLASNYRIHDYVKFAGYVPLEKAREYFAIASMVVLPSITTAKTKEPWGLVINEAFNQSVPAIVTEAVGSAAGGMVKDNYNGLIVPEKNSKALQGSIRLLCENKDLRISLGRNAQQSVRKWNNSEMVQGFANAIDYAMLTSETKA